MYIGLLVSQVRQVQEVHYHPDEEVSVAVPTPPPHRLAFWQRIRRLFA
jgi:hypothetical protein